MGQKYAHHHYVDQWDLMRIEDMQRNQQGFSNFKTFWNYKKMDSHQFKKLHLAKKKKKILLHVWERGSALPLVGIPYNRSDWGESFRSLVQP